MPIQTKSITEDEQIEPLTAEKIKKEFDRIEDKYREIEMTTGIPFCRKCLHLDWEMQYNKGSVTYTPSPYEGRTAGVKPIEAYQNMKQSKVFTVAETYANTMGQTRARVDKKYVQFMCPLGHSVSFEEIPDTVKIFERIDKKPEIKKTK